ncbi:MAG: polysaccharide biosynthesis/export family protein [Terriglobales bacterium]
MKFDHLSVSPRAVASAALLLCGLMAGFAPRAAAQGDNAAPPPDPGGEYVAPLADPSVTPLGAGQWDTVSPVTSDSYRIGVNDLLSVFVFQMPEMNREVRVSSNGQIQLPFVHHSFTAAGETPAGLARQIENALTVEGLALHPQARVAIRQILSKPIIVSGAVRLPVTIQAAHPISLLEALTRAGGFSPNQPAGDAVLISHPDGKEPIRVDLQRLLLQLDARDNVMLTGGELVQVLPARLVYAVGALGKPGAFPLQTGEPITVLRAIALAEGVKEPADKRHAEVIHTLPDGTRQETTVDIDRILRRKSADVTLAAGDIFYLPENGRRKALNAILGDVGQAAVLTIGYR